MVPLRPLPWTPPRGRLWRALVVAVLLAGGAALLHTRPFLLTRLSVHGLHQVTVAEVEANLALPPGTYTWQIRPWVLTRRLAADPLVRASSIHLLWPDGVTIALTERVPSALVLDGLSAWEIDATGRLLRALADETGAAHLTAPGLPVGLPVISGASLATPQAGRPVENPVVLAALAVAETLGGTVGRQVALVTVAPDGAIGVRTGGGVPVNYGNGASAATKTQELLGILECAQTLGAAVAAIDLSAPLTPAVRIQPGSPPWRSCLATTPVASS